MSVCTVFRMSGPWEHVLDRHTHTHINPVAEVSEARRGRA